MGWFLLEVLVALVIAVGIVWWTMGLEAPQDRATTANAGRAEPKE